jgi:2',3'-cyclic-nucleotide 2'-phosphodiesterase (5'-nucleotidase family)
MSRKEQFMYHVVHIADFHSQFMNNTDYMCMCFGLPTDFGLDYTVQIIQFVHEAIIDIFEHLSFRNYHLH